MSRWIIVVLALAAINCSKSDDPAKPVPEPPPAKTAAPDDAPPAAKATPPDTGDDCLANCMTDGPDSDPGTVEDWKNGDAQKRSDICSDECAGGDSPPVDQVDELDE